MGIETINKPTIADIMAKVDKGRTVIANVAGYRSDLTVVGVDEETSLVRLRDGDGRTFSVNVKYISNVLYGVAADSSI